MSERHLTIVLLTLLAGASTVAQEPPLHDPMQPFEYLPTPGAVERAGPQPLELTAVLVSSQRRVAVINGAIHREGDWIAGAQITRIEPQVVHLRRGSEDFVVRLKTRRAGSQTDQGDSAS